MCFDQYEAKHLIVMKMITYNPSYRRGVHQRPSFTSFQNQTPSINVIRKENGFQIEMAVPGLSREDLTIDIQDRQLKISAKEKINDQKPKFVRQEFNYGTFEKSFHLSDKTDISGITATCENGILKLWVPDRATETRNITIQ